LRNKTAEPIGAPFLTLEKVDNFLERKRMDRFSVISSKRADILIMDFNEVSINVV
jgi:hypothetical protein